MHKFSKEKYLQIARLHSNGINQGFLTTLGENFLALLYECIDADKHSVLLTIEREGKVVGFVSGTEYGMKNIYKQLLMRLGRLTVTLLPSVLSPVKMFRILEVLTHGGEVSTKLPRAELLSIVVDSNYRNQGFAAELFRKLDEHFISRNIDGFRIVVGDGLSAAHRFYIRMGAKSVGVIRVHRGADSVIYVKSK